MENIEIKDTTNKEGRYLSFELGKEEYGIEILKVKEIIGIVSITTVPQTPDYMKGVINLRGRVIPIIDMRLKFSIPEIEYTKETCIVVVEVHKSLIGIIVDRVSEVLEIKSEDTEDAPAFGQAIDTKFIMGLGKVKGKIIIMIDIEKVLSSEELELVEQMAS